MASLVVSLCYEVDHTIDLQLCLRSCISIEAGICTFDIIHHTSFKRKLWCMCTCDP